MLPANLRQQMGLHSESVLTVRLEGDQLILQRADILSPDKEPAVEEIGGFLMVDAEISGDPRTVVERMRQERPDRLANL
ncbi:hypothetical protein [Gloeobacter kilaueensis]|uniref:hypothetical protein n=1 Tax=Gloeobacter kilaueensis TaxID=1416614 RepID=UPI00059CED05